MAKDAPKIVTPDRISLPVLQKMRDEFQKADDMVGLYAMDFLIMKTLELDHQRASYVEPLMAACHRELQPETAE